MPPQKIITSLRAWKNWETTNTPTPALLAEEIRTSFPNLTSELDQLIEEALKSTSLS